jgi:hypothetical protein
LTEFCRVKKSKSGMPICEMNMPLNMFKPQ